MDEMCVPKKSGRKADGRVEAVECRLEGSAAG